MANHAVLAYNYWGGGTEFVSPYAGKSDWVDYLGLKGFAPNAKTEFPQLSDRRCLRFRGRRGGNC